MVRPSRCCVESQHRFDGEATKVDRTCVHLGLGHAVVAFMTRRSFDALPPTSRPKGLPGVGLQPRSFIQVKLVVLYDGF